MLVIDDEPLLGSIVARLMGEAHRVDVATRAKDALGRLVCGDRYDVIFCDVLMPEMSGIEFFDEVTRRFPAQARCIVFVTGGVLEAAVRMRLDEVRIRVLEKPVDIRVMLRVVDEHLDLPAPQAAVAE